jgi:ankyrin repeat protein
MVINAIRHLLRKSDTRSCSSFDEKATRAIFDLCSKGGMDAELKEFARRGGNVNERYGEFKGTALEFASFYHRDALCEALIDTGALVNAHNRLGCSALHAAVDVSSPSIGRATDDECAKTSTLLLARGINVDIQDRYLNTALHIAASYGLHKTATVLIQRGASLTLRDAFNKTPFMNAAVNGLKPMCQLLLRRQLLALMVPEGTSILAMRKALKETIFLFKARGDFWICLLPLDVKVMIFQKAYARELVCLLLDARCCHLLPVQSDVNLRTLRETLPKLFDEEKIGKTMTDILTAAHRRTETNAVKELLNPATLRSSLEQLFID